MKRIDCRVEECRNISNIVFIYANELDFGEYLIIDIPREYMDIILNICEAMCLKPLSVRLCKDYCSILVIKEPSVGTKYCTE